MHPVSLPTPKTCTKHDVLAAPMSLSLPMMKGIRIRERMAGRGMPIGATGPSGGCGLKGVTLGRSDDPVATRKRGRSQIILRTAQRAAKTSRTDSQRNLI